MQTATEPTTQTKRDGFHRRASRITLALVVFLLLLLVVLVKCIPMFLDKEQLKTSIQKGLEQSTGVHFKIQELTMDSTIFHGLQVNLNTNTITDEKKRPLGNIDNITIEIRYLPLLLRRTPSIAKIHINHAYVPVGDQSLFTALKLNLKEPEETGFIKPAKLEDAEILLTNYLVEDLKPSKVAHDFLPKARQFRLEGESFSIRHLQSDKPISMLSNGTLVFTTGNGIQQAGEQKALRILMGSYALFAEIPQDVTKKGHRMTASDLGRLNVEVKGPDIAFKVRYQHKKHEDGIGTFNSGWTSLSSTQALVSQLGDTFGIPIPDQLMSVYLAGNATINDGFRLSFTDPDHAKARLSGRLQLSNAAAARASAWPDVFLSRLNGNVKLDGDVISLEDVTGRLSSLPLRLQGQLNVNTHAINMLISGQSLRVSSLRQTVADLGGSSASLNGLDLKGLVDFTARITGTTDIPDYKGTLALRNGAFQSAKQGLAVNNVDGKFNFAGRGLQSPTIAYGGVIHVNDGKLLDASKGLRVNRFDGQIVAQGVISAGGGNPPMPDYHGTINVRDADYKDPKTGLLVSGIHGLLDLGGKVINIRNFQASMGGASFLANGNITSDFKRYKLRVVSHNINIQRFKRDVLAKLPQAQGVLASIDPYSGRASLDATVSTGMNLNGRLNLTQVALRTGNPDFPIRVPAMTISFSNNRVSVPETTVWYGTVALRFGGTFSKGGTYRFAVASKEIPLSLLRDNIEMLTMFTGAEVPEIFNTSGSVAINGVIGNANTNMTLAFNNAGLSWRGGDFPLYDLNGAVYFKQAGHGKPVISTRDLNFRYGNSPIAADVENGGRFSMTSNGVISPLVVNHFLVSHTNEATPYREIPFKVAADGLLAALPGDPNEAKNDVQVQLQLDLNPNFKEGNWAVDAKPEEDVPADTLRPSQDSVPDGNATGAGPDMTAEPPRGQTVHKVLSKLNPIQGVKTLGHAVLSHVNLVRDVKQAVGLTKQVVTSAVDKVRHLAEFRQKEEVVQPQHAEVNTENPNAPATAATPETPAPTATENTRIDPGSLPATVASALPAAGDDNAFFDGRFHLAGPDLLIDQALLHLFNAGDIITTGQVTHALDTNNREMALRVQALPELSLNRLSHSSRNNDFFRGAGGTIGLDLQVLSSAQASNALQGWLAFNKTALPYLTVRDLTGRFDFNGSGAVADIPSFAIPGLTTSATATTDDIFQLPVTLENVKINGSLISIESLAEFNQNVMMPIINEQLIHNFIRPRQTGDPVVPIQFRDADMHFDEMIFQNIITNNLDSKFSLFANSYFEMNDTRLEAAGGTATGYFSMNPNDNNFMTLELNASQVKANALTKALLNVTNQIFGDLSGTVRFTSFGATPEDLQANANGTVSVKVTDGRLPAIAKVETLLAAANIFRGGILGLNLNNLFRTLNFGDTNYFAELSGDMLINNQSLYTDNLVSDGVNLDLFIQGGLRMDTGAANMLVNGRMSQDVSGMFGALGKFSVGSILRYIPGLGNLGGGRTGLIGRIPVVGYTPGFGGPAGDVNRFQVRLVGRLDEPGAIQDFHWVRSQSL